MCELWRVEWGWGFMGVLRVLLRDGDWERLGDGRGDFKEGREIKSKRERE